MREGAERAIPPSEEGSEGGGTGHSIARMAEELVRAGGGDGVAWQGARLATCFQPIFGVRRGKCLGYEAFVRATGPDGAQEAAGRLFARSGAANRLVLDWACRALHLRNYAVVDPGDRTLFLNVHPEAAVGDARRGRELGELIRYYGLVPRRVCVEMIEAESGDEGAAARGDRHLPHDRRLGGDGRIRRRVLQFRSRRGAQARRGEDRPLDVRRGQARVRSGRGACCRAWSGCCTRRGRA